MIQRVLPLETTVAYLGIATAYNNIHDSVFIMRNLTKNTNMVKYEMLC